MVCYWIYAIGNGAHETGAALLSSRQRPRGLDWVLKASRGEGYLLRLVHHAGLVACRLKTAHLPRALLQQSVGQGTSSMGGRVVLAKLLLLLLLLLVEAPVLLLRWPQLQWLQQQRAKLMLLMLLNMRDLLLVRCCARSAGGDGSARCCRVRQEVLQGQLGHLHRSRAACVIRTAGAAVANTSKEAACTDLHRPQQKQHSLQSLDHG